MTPCKNHVCEQQIVSMTRAIDRLIEQVNEARQAGQMTAMQRENAISRVIELEQENAALRKEIRRVELDARI